MSNSNSVEPLHLSSEELIEEAVNNNEGIIASNGAFSTSTGKRTGRSPNDRFICEGGPGTAAGGGGLIGRRRA